MWEMHGTGRDSAAELSSSSTPGMLYPRPSEVHDFVKYYMYIRMCISLEKSLFTLLPCKFQEGSVQQSTSHIVYAK